MEIFSERPLLKRLRGQEAGKENYWENVGGVYFYPMQKYVLIYPEGKEIKLKPVEEVVSRNPNSVTNFWEKGKPYFRYDFTNGIVDFFKYYKRVTVYEAEA